MADTRVKNNCCPQCNRDIRVHETSIKCTWCKIQYHTKCILPCIQLGQNTNEWTCKHCNTTIFPFNNLENEDNYLSTVTNELIYNHCKLDELE